MVICLSFCHCVLFFFFNYRRNKLKEIKSVFNIYFETVQCFREVNYVSAVTWKCSLLSSAEFAVTEQSNWNR